jgi:hypothetical protein
MPARSHLRRSWCEVIAKHKNIAEYRLRTRHFPIAGCFVPDKNGCEEKNKTKNFVSSIQVGIEIQILLISRTSSVRFPSWNSCWFKWSNWRKATRRRQVDPVPTLLERNVLSDAHRRSKTHSRLNHANVVQVFDLGRHQVRGQCRRSGQRQSRRHQRRRFGRQIVRHRQTRP